MQKFFMKEEADKLETAIAALKKDGEVEIWNAYETFYGVGFDRWLRDSIKHLDCKIKVVRYDSFEGFPKTYHISL